MDSFTTLRRKGYLVIRNGDRVITAEPAGQGFTAKVYDLIDDPDVFGFADCRLEETLASNQIFYDAGDAISWALTKN